MTIRIEFFGIPRTRAGIAQLEVEASSLCGAFEAIAIQVPGWAEACLSGKQLRRGLIANLNGQRFISDPDTVLESGDSVLILSADVGG